MAAVWPFDRALRTCGTNAGVLEEEGTESGHSGGEGEAGGRGVIEAR